MEMCFKIKVLFSVLLLTSNLIQMSEAVFVKVGNYPKDVKYGINTPECGFRNVAQNITITRTDKCFVKTVGNITWNGQENAFPEWAPNTGIEIGEAPWILSIKILLKGGLFDPKRYIHCSGVLITLRWVLTAAHCFKDAKWLWLYAGSNTENTHVQLAQAKSFQDLIIHKDKDKKENDIGLIHLFYPFKRETDGDRYLVNTICLPEKDVLNTESEEIMFFGFAKTTSGDSTYSLQKGQSFLVPYPKRHCTDQMFCNMEPIEDKICATDTGGPAVQYIDSKSRAVLIGIATDETLCGPLVRLLNFISIPLKVEWILHTIDYITNITEDKIYLPEEGFEEIIEI